MQRPADKALIVLCQRMRTESHRKPGRKRPGQAQISDARANLHKTGIEFVCTDAQKECQASGSVLNYRAAKRITSGRGPGEPERSEQLEVPQVFDLK
jgi:hypothetical protein